MFSETRYALNGDLRVAYRTSREGRSRHRVRPELVHLLRASAGAAVTSGVGRGDDVTRSADLLRPARHGSVRSRQAGRAADFGAMGRQHHRSARRSRESRSCPPRADGAVATAALFAATHPSRTTALVVIEGYADSRSPNGFDLEDSWMPLSPCGDREINTRSIQTCRGMRIFGQRGPEGTPGGEPTDRRTNIAADANGHASGASDNSRAHSGRPPRGRPVVPPASGRYIADHIPGREIR